ncbi:MAG: exodeoxyribonuclease VII large subunit [Actinobacteria bacterium]|nr:exodeoxyribonuclease VII large subunit [Actinomycetota bacterium]
MSTPRAELPATAGQTSAERPWPVRLLTAKLTEYLSKAPAVWLEGQVVQLTRRPGQATCYLTLRDTDVDLSFSVTVHARTLDALPVPLADGAHVVVHAKPELFPRRGSLSLSASDLRPVGVGELLARLEHLRRVLASEGLFAESRKRPLPFLPRVVGLVCGRASAAERDVVENAQRRWPAVRFDVRNVAVQGPNAVPEVVDAVAALDAAPEVDVIVVTRGGGSLEDLLPFSNESLVRAVAACRTPVVSAIGHEVDTPLLDLVADVRASTPTDAAKRVVPDVVEELARVAQGRDRARAAVLRMLDREEHLLRGIRERSVLADPYRLLSGHADAVADLRRRSRAAVSTRLDRAADDVTHLRGRVAALSPAATLARGYAVVQTREGEVVRDPADVGDGVLLRLRLVGGDLAARAAGPWVPDALPTTTRKARSAKKAAAPAPASRKRAARSAPPAPPSPPDPTEADA